MGLRAIERPLLFRIEDSNVRDRAADERTASAKVKTMGRASAEEFDNTGKWNTLFAMQFGDGQRESSFQPGNAKRSALKFHFFFVGSMGSVISSDSIDRSIRERDQNCFEIRSRAQRGI